MSSLAVRNAIKAAVEAAAGAIPVRDLSDYVELKDALADINSQAVLIQYTASDERVECIGGANTAQWEEDGTVVLHLVVPTGFDSAPVVTQGDAIKSVLRGQRLGTSITIESCSPFTDFGGATGLYGGAWKGWAANLYYTSHSSG